MVSTDRNFRIYGPLVHNDILQTAFCKHTEYENRVLLWFPYLYFEISLLVGKQKSCRPGKKTNIKKT